MQNGDQICQHHLKIKNTNRSVEVNVIKLEEENHLVLLFKEITIAKNLQQSTVRENFTNVFINSTAHNIFTPINGIKLVTELIANEV